MTFTSSPITVKDKDGNAKSIMAFTDGTNTAFANVLVDASGAVTSPATASGQATAATALTTIATNTANLPAKGSATSANALPVVIASDQAALPLPTGASTAAAQATGNTSLGTIATNTTGLATAAAQTTGNTSLAAIATAVQAATPAGTNLIGKVGIDQTTPGTTNGVAVVSALPSGANAIGTVGVTALPALPAGTNTIGAVSQAGNGVHLTAAPAVTAGAYTTGMVVGGLISLANAARVNAGSGLIQSVLVTVKTALTAPYDVFFFDTNPTNSTFTDNAALAINPLDLPSVCGIAHCTDLVSCGTPQILQATNCGIEYKLSAAATTLYAVIVIRGAQTFASTSAVGLSVVELQD